MSVCRTAHACTSAIATQVSIATFCDDAVYVSERLRRRPLSSVCFQLVCENTITAGKLTASDARSMLKSYLSLKLKPNSITLAGSKLVRSWSPTGSKPNSITLSGSKLVADKLRTSI